MSAAKTPSNPVKPPVIPPKTPDNPPQAALPNETENGTMPEPKVEITSPMRGDLCQKRLIVGDDVIGCSQPGGHEGECKWSYAVGKVPDFIKREPAAPPVVREEEVTVMELTLSDLHTLSSLLSINIQSPADLISRVRRMSVMSIDGAEIRLEDGLLTRLKSRALSQWGPEWLTKTVKDQLHAYVGW